MDTIEDLVLTTIEDVFSENLRRLRGARTQAEMAEAVGVAIRTYQTYENGVIPQGPNRTSLAQALGVPETKLFQDPDLDPAPETALRELLAVLPALNNDEIEALLTTAQGMASAKNASSDHLKTQKKGNHSP